MKLQHTVINTKIKELTGDLHTAIGLYASIRNYYQTTLLLESTDFTADSNCFSYICINPIAGFKATKNNYSYFYPNKPLDELNSEKTDFQEVLGKFTSFKESFSNSEMNYPKGVINGFFGYITFDAVQYFEDISFEGKSNEGREIPDLQYHLYRYVLVINHFKHKMYLIENYVESEDINQLAEESKLLLNRIKNQEARFGSFNYKDEESSNFTDSQFIKVVEKCKEHIQRGDVFQIVPSRRFETEYTGDCLLVYRALRSINPSPYLFYFNYGDFRIIGSSPEAELITSDGKAEIYPIAGTTKRTTSSIEDEKQVNRLLEDAKENAEHVMLVDLARNDLSKHCVDVKVDSFRDVHYFSHVIHLVSKVSGKMKNSVNAITLLADTFPAGTLSGAPKYRAMELIDRYENGNRGFYGGALGFIGFNNDSHHAIMIRTFLSKNGKLYRQAGAGTVIGSKPENELQEVNSKLEALKLALKEAKKLGEI